MLQQTLEAKMTSLEIMQAVLDGKMTPAEADKIIKTKTLKLKVSVKGAVQLDGLRRFPVTLYADEWEKVLEMKDEITAFINANRSKLTEKGD